MTAHDLFEVHLPPTDPDAAMAHAQHKRTCFPWNDWGQRLSYADLITSGAALLEAWADPAFVCSHTGVAGVWLRAEVWLHPDGTAFRTVLDVHGCVVVPPLECCQRPHDLREGILLPAFILPPALRAAAEVTP